MAPRVVRSAASVAVGLGIWIIGSIAYAGEPSAGVASKVLRGPSGAMVSLRAPAGGATALIFYSCECPISNAYSPTLNELAQSFPKGKLNLVGVCIDPDLNDAAIAQHAAEYRLAFPVARDREGALARKLGVKVTPEAVVIDADDHVRYRGRVDDQFAARQKRNANPQTQELRAAIAAVLAGAPVDAAVVEAVGCPLPETPKAAAKPTYAKDVAVILQKHCQECHRPGQVGPFALMDYKSAAKRAGDIVNVTESRTMPPWKPEPGFGPKYKHDRSLTESEIATLAAWVDAGSPEGDPADLPPPTKFTDDWALGTPDLVLEPGVDFEIPAGGDDIYRCFVIPTKEMGDRFISAIEYRPGNRRVVHHVLSYVDVTGKARERDEKEPGPGYSCFSGPGVETHGDLGGWAPGNEPSRLPDGVGRSLPKGADVVMQVHYHPSGKPEKDRTRIGLYFSRKPVKQTLHWVAALDPVMYLPPGPSNTEIKADWTANTDLTAYAVTPHMHMLGRDMAIQLTLPNGQVQKLVKVPNWDFGWQNTYYFEKPIEVPKGAKLEIVAHYDNSSKNPRNPSRDKPKPVFWGEATTDEMCIGFLAVVKKGQDLTKPGEVDDLHELIEDSYKEKEKEWDARKKDLKEKLNKEQEKAKAKAKKS
jgi:mono/diheme cytochrome c family protein